MSFDTEKYGPWAVIAGGSEGVGVGFARILAEAGMNLLLMARKEDALAETAKELGATGVEIRVLSVDLTAPDMLNRIRSATEGLDVGLFIFNAGANTNHALFLDSPAESVQRVIDLNITAPLELARYFGAGMKSRGSGGIILVGSLAGYMGQPEISVYAGAKAFGRVFSEGLWLELREHNVDVLQLILGVTRTPAMERHGLRFDLPGLNVAEPFDVAREGLENIANGPVYIAGGNYGLAERRNGMDRAELVSSSHERSRQLIGQGD